ncbi:hypothetical protein PC123_g22306 [Phytophthora cactorum]|nr:hypothetical protein PC123_g22306 [Phytophthora cactorum]
MGGDSKRKYGEDVRNAVKLARRWVSETPLQGYMAYRFRRFASKAVAYVENMHCTEESCAEANRFGHYRDYSKWQIPDSSPDNADTNRQKNAELYTKFMAEYLFRT